MKFRWTIEDCQTYSDYRMLLGLVNERLSDLNGYTPFAQRLKQLQKKLEAREPLTTDDTPNRQ